MLGRQNTKKAYRKDTSGPLPRTEWKKDGGNGGKEELDQHYGNTYVSVEAESNILQKGQGVVENECVGSRQHWRGEAPCLFPL